MTAEVCTKEVGVITQNVVQGAVYLLVGKL